MEGGDENTQTNMGTDNAPNAPTSSSSTSAAKKGRNKAQQREVMSGANSSMDGDVDASHAVSVPVQPKTPERRLPTTRSQASDSGDGLRPASPIHFISAIRSRGRSGSTKQAQYPLGRLLTTHHSLKDSNSAAPTRTNSERSLGNLSSNFISICQNQVAQGEYNIDLEEVTEQLGVRRRRIYDIVNILESVNIVSRSEKNSYRWEGISQVRTSFANLMKSGLKDIERVEQATTAGVEPSTSYPKLFKGPPVTAQWLLTAKPNPEIVAYMAAIAESGVAAAAPTVQGATGVTVEKKDKSLGVLSQKFIQLFLLGRCIFIPVTDGSTPTCSKDVAQVVTLDSAAKVLLPEDIEPNTTQYRTKVRRLYDIANVFVHVGLIGKVQLDDLRKPAFKWLGGDIDTLNLSSGIAFQSPSAPFQSRASRVRQRKSNREQKPTITSLAGLFPSDSPPSQPGIKSAPTMASVSFGFAGRQEPDGTQATADVPTIPPAQVAEALSFLNARFWPEDMDTSREGAVDAHAALRVTQTIQLVCGKYFGQGNSVPGSQQELGLFSRCKDLGIAATLAGLHQRHLSMVQDEVEPFWKDVENALEDNQDDDDSVATAEERGSAAAAAAAADTQAQSGSTDASPPQRLKQSEANTPPQSPSVAAGSHSHVMSPRSARGTSLLLKLARGGAGDEEQ